MTPVKFSLDSFKDVTGSGPRYIATTKEPWFELRTEIPLSGACVHLDWSAGLFDPVCRLVVRFLRADLAEDFILAGASCGRNSWTGRVPTGTTRILLSPMHVAGEFGFRVDRFVRLSFVEMMARAVRRRPVNAFLSLTARLRGWHQASQSELREVFQSTDLRAYDLWRRDRLRPVEPEIDGNESVSSCRRMIGIVLPLTHLDISACKLVVDELSKQCHLAWKLFVAVTWEDTFGSGWVGDPRIHVLPIHSTIEDILSLLPKDALLHVMHADAHLDATLLRQMAEAAEQHSGATLFYCDQDHYRLNRNRCWPQFKGDFDPLLVQNLDIVGATGFWNANRLSGRLALDLPVVSMMRGLRQVAKALDKDDVVHISRALVSLPVGQGVAPITPTISAEATSILDAGTEPFISVIVPTRDRLDLLKPCIESLFRFSRVEIELIVVDNGSRVAETHAYFEELKRNPSIKVLSVDAPFNYSDLCNRGVALASSKRLLFLNNDTEFLEAGWEAILSSYLEKNVIGAIGAKLLYRSRRVQHAGITIGLHGRSGHFEIGMTDNDPGYFRRANLSQQTLAVTGACLAVRRDAFDAIGGFDADHLPVDLNDMDFCLRLVERGFINLYLPAWKLAHYESATRGRVHESDRIYGTERAYFASRWLPEIRNDPTFNVNLSLWRTSAALG